MSNLVDATGAPPDHRSILHDSDSPSEAAPFINKAWETMDGHAHNCVEESYGEENAEIIHLLPTNKLGHYPLQHSYITPPPSMITHPIPSK